MTKRKLKKAALDAFGKPPARHYFSDDIYNVGAYFRHRRQSGMDDFYVDDITCNDLALDEVYKRINLGSSTSGEQYLYYLLRTPAQNAAAYDERRKTIALVEQDPALRLRLQTIILQLGRKREINPNEIFNPSHKGVANLLLSLLLLIGLLCSIAAAAFFPKAAVYILLFMIVNMAYHTAAIKKLESELPTVNYAVSMLIALDKVRKLKSVEIDALFETAYASSKKLTAVKRVGGVSFAANNELLMVFNHVFLIDLIYFEFVKNRIGKYHAEIFAIHEAVGRLDAAIAIASYRQSMEIACDPVLDFSSGVLPYIECVDAVHPLLDTPVANNIETKQSVLLTGSNASGKSTFLKSIALAAVFAQSLCTAPCTVYKATSFRILSSMAVADDVVAGDSYFVAEIRSLKRIMDLSATDGRILCVIDEVLRGTNTVERVAASSQLLGNLGAKPNVLCFAATHDLELCALLASQYSQYHFEESVSGDAVVFDYLLKPGAATTRNAIKLLAMMGYDEKLVADANQRAQYFLDNGVWQ